MGGKKNIPNCDDDFWLLSESIKYPLMPVPSLVPDSIHLIDFDWIDDITLETPWMIFNLQTGLNELFAPEPVWI